MLAAACLFLSPAILAQGFDSGSNASDGALAFPANAGTLVFDPAAFNPRLDPDGDNVYHFTTVTVPAGTTVRLRADLFGEGRPVLWLASGAVEIAGAIDLNGDAGSSGAQASQPTLAGAGGFHGGPGGANGGFGQAGNGPGGGRGGKDASGRLGGRAGHTIPGPLFGTVPGGPAYGNRYLFPLIGGSGGGGSSNESTPGASGGGGGGALLLASSVSIQLTGSISARGGAGGTIGLGAGGGHGSGGAIRLMAPVVSGGGALDVSGTGTQGAHGRVRIERFLDRYSGSIAPANAAVRSSPGSVFEPAGAPRVRIASVGGANVAGNPTASFVTPDVTVNSAGSLSIEIEAANIPLGTQIRLRIVPEEGDELNLDSTPLAGTLASSTATASATLASGFTKIFISAAWGP